MRTLRQSVPTGTLPGAMITLSALWLACAYADSLYDQHSKDGWSASPLSVMLVLLAVPVSMLVLIPWLLRARRTGGRKLAGLDYVALIAGAAPPVIVAVMLSLAFLFG